MVVILWWGAVGRLLSEHTLLILSHCSPWIRNENHYYHESGTGRNYPFQFHEMYPDTFNIKGSCVFEPGVNYVTTTLEMVVTSI